jgi:hypothetical protein
MTSFNTTYNNFSSFINFKEYKIKITINAIISGPFFILLFLKYYKILNKSYTSPYIALSYTY